MVERIRKYSKSSVFSFFSNDISNNKFIVAKMKFDGDEKNTEKIEDLKAIILGFLIIIIFLSAVVILGVTIFIFEEIFLGIMIILFLSSFVIVFFMFCWLIGKSIIEVSEE